MAFVHKIPDSLVNGRPRQRQYKYQGSGWFNIDPCAYPHEVISASWVVESANVIGDDRLDLWVGPKSTHAWAVLGIYHPADAMELYEKARVTAPEELAGKLIMVYTFKGVYTEIGSSPIIGFDL